MYFRISLALLCLAVKTVHGNQGNQGNQGKGIAVSGGYGALTSMEVYDPSTGQSCSLPPLPEDRMDHTMDNLYICGGQYTGTVGTSCLHFSSGQWTTNYTLVEERSDHTSWWTDQGLIIMGGEESPSTSEIVPTTGGQGGPSFAMKNGAAFACAIPDTTSGTVVITGGYYSMKKMVSRYDLQGHVEDLPQLIEGRYQHGCGSFMRVDGTQVMMVAGGFNSNGDGSYDILSSTEVLTTDSTAWTMVTPLPRGVWGVRGVTLGNTLYMTGGNDNIQHGIRAEVIEWNDEKQEWVENGKLQMARSYHSVSTIQLEGEVMDYCG